MAPVKAQMKDPTWPQLVQKCLQEGVDISARYWYVNSLTNYVCKREISIVKTLKFQPLEMVLVAVIPVVNKAHVL